MIKIIMAMFYNVDSNPNLKNLMHTHLICLKNYITAHFIQF